MKLKPCPMCGSTEVAVRYNPGSWGYYESSAKVTCGPCRTAGPKVHGDSDGDESVKVRAAEAWNKRYEVPADGDWRHRTKVLP